MAEPALGTYVYGVVPEAARPSLDHVAGVDPGHPMEIVAHRGLAAIASPVSLDEFGPEPLKRNLNDLEWLERTARAHQAVLDRALAAGELVPLRLCTVFAGPAHVRDMLEREHDVLIGALERVRGCAEWSVKVTADPGRLREAVGHHADAPAEASRPGHAYLARKKQDRLAADEARGLAERAAGEIHERLLEEARAGTLLRPQHPDLSRRAGDMILNGAYLVERARAGEFEALAGELGERHRELGLELDISGPWAPYNFVSAGGDRDER